jgi:hypothetical protein
VPKFIDQCGRFWACEVVRIVMSCADGRHRSPLKNMRIAVSIAPR